MKVIKLVFATGLLCIILSFVLLQYSTHAVVAQPLANEFTEAVILPEGGNFASAAWGDYDKDGDLDVLLTGASNAGLIAKVYRNDNGIFADINAGLEGVWQGSVDWGDYDNDNDLDILITGEVYPSSITKIYHNEGGVFSDIHADLPGTSEGTARWGDYDRDGDLDFVLTGNSPNYSATIFRNSNGQFIDVHAQLSGVTNSNVAWGDYDSDGDLDLAISGTSSDVYRNDNGSFTNVYAGLHQVLNGSVDWGDCDSDGDLDLLFNGYGLLVYEYLNSSFVSHSMIPNGTKNGTASWGDFDNDGDLDILIMGNPSTLNVYRNDGNFVFNDISAGLPSVQNGVAVWGDYNGDGKLDFLVSGETENYERIAKIYQNNSSVSNSAPTAPSGLTASASPFTATLSWNAATDSQTSQSGLTYNVRIGTTPNGTDFLSPMSDPTTGYRYIPRMGNAGHITSFTVKGLKPGTKYYWSVQAVDSAFSGSVFAQEGSFETPMIYLAYLPILQKPYPVYIPPGIYVTNQCVEKDLYIRGTYAGKLTECVPSVEVRATGHMQFNFTWTVDLAEGITSITKYSDANNPNMYITDNLANRYDHVDTGGAAAQTVTLYDGVPVEGWFLFIPAKFGANTFAFTDGDQGIVINNIVLTP